MNNSSVLVYPEFQSSSDHFLIRTVETWSGISFPQIVLSVNVSGSEWRFPFATCNSEHLRLTPANALLGWK